MKFSNILIPTDFSDSSKHALHYGIGFAKRFNSALDMLHVTESLPFPAGVDYEGFEVANVASVLHEQAEQGFEQLVRETPDLGDLRHTTNIRAGVAYMEIINFAAEQKSDLIILATHGRSGLSHFLMGSVAEKVVRNSPCPVLTVKMPDFEFQQA